MEDHIQQLEADNKAKTHVVARLTGELAQFRDGQTPDTCPQPPESPAKAPPPGLLLALHALPHPQQPFPALPSSSLRT